MEMSESKFVHYNNSIRFIHGENKEFFRIAGEWVQKVGIKEIGAESNYLPTFKLLLTLPGWPLVDGINMNKNSGGFIPDSHQFIPMDLLEAGWLSGFGVRDGNGLRRSRILISDEGGTGKTLSASLAADIAYAITSSNPVTQNMYQLFQEKLKEARFVDATEGQNLNPDNGQADSIGSSSFINSRY
jgi:hypothetical protein